MLGRAEFRTCRLRGKQMALPAPAGDLAAMTCSEGLLTDRQRREQHYADLTTHTDDRSGRTAGAAPRAGAGPGSFQRRANRRDRRERPERPLTR
jgi:hypothetical protein